MTLVLDRGVSLGSKHLPTPSLNVELLSFGYLLVFLLTWVSLVGEFRILLFVCNLTYPGLYFNLCVTETTSDGL